MDLSPSRKHKTSSAVAHNLLDLQIFHNCKKGVSNGPTGPQSLPKTDHFLFVYGSLMHCKSRKRTLPSSTSSVPCILKGFLRLWSYNCRNVYTAVAVTEISKDLIRRKGWEDIHDMGVNGLLLPIHTMAELEDCDEREKHYKRTRLEFQDLSFDFPFHVPVLGSDVISHLKLPTTTVYTYALRNSPHILPSHSPSPAVPLSQQYLDIILLGCLNVHFDFAVHFLKTTIAFSRKFLIDDRHRGRDHFKEWPKEESALVDILLRMWDDGNAAIPEVKS